MTAPSTTTPSPWVARFVDLIPTAGLVLDLACGGGRHARFLRTLEFRVVAVDIDVSRIAGQDIEIVQADLENAPWPLSGRSFDGIVVTNYLHRPLFPVLVESLRGGGVLIYETFAAGNERFGKPSNPNFLLRRGELLDAVQPDLTVIAYEDLEIDTPRPAVVQRICARRPQE